MQRSTAVANSGDTVTYEIFIGNVDDPSINLVACDVENLDVGLFCPGLNGLPSGTSVMVVTGVYLPAGTPPVSIGNSPSCVLKVRPRITVATASVRIGDQDGPIDELGEGRLHVSEPDRPFRQEQLITTSILVPTTTTIPSSCGNGVVDSGEECDPPAGSPDNDCCLECRVYQFNVGRRCDPERTLGLCETADRCTAQGQCRPTLVPADPPRLCGVKSDPCDPRDFCDGQHPECPSGDQCGAELRPMAGGGGIEVICNAPTTDEGTFKCSATGFAVKDPSVPTCSAERYTGKASVRLQGTPDGGSVSARSNLRLNPRARRILQDTGSVQVCVVVETKFAGSRVKPPESRLVTVTR